MLTEKKNLSTILPWAFALVGALLAIRTVSDFDMGWHIAAGRWMWQHRQIVSADTFSFTATGSPWTSIPWAYELILYVCFSAGGVAAVVLFHALLTGTISFFAWKNVSPGAKDPEAVFLAAALLLLALFAVEIRWNGRPEVFGQLWGTLMLFVLLRFRRSPLAVPWVVALVQLGWVNTHGTFIFGPFLIGLFLAASVLEHGIDANVFRRVWEHPLFRALGLALVACLFNPRGLTGAMYPLHLLGVLHNPVYHQMNSEIRSPFADADWGPDTWALVLWLSAIIGIVVKNGVKQTVRDYSLAFPVLVAVLTWGALAGRRNIALLILWTSPFVVDGARRALTGVIPERFRHRAPAATVALFAVAVLAVVTNLHRSPRTVLRFGADITRVHRADAAIKFLRERGVTSRSFADIEMANSLLWKYPGYPMYIDSRLAEVYTPDRFQRYEDVLAHPRLFDEEAELFKLEHVVLMHSASTEVVSGLLLHLGSHPSWRRVYLDDVVVIFARKGTPTFAALAPHASSDEALLRRLVDESRAPSSFLELLNVWKGDRAKPLLHAADMLAALGSPNVAEQAVTEAMGIDRHLGAVWTTACRVTFMRLFAGSAQAQRVTAEEIDAAEERCRRAIAEDDGPSYQALGLIYLNTGRFEQGIAALEMATRRMPLSYPSFLVLGDARAAVGGPQAQQGALDALQEAARLRPFETDPLVKIAALLEKMNRKEEAVAFLSHAQKLRPDAGVAKSIARLRGN